MANPTKTTSFVVPRFTVLPLNVSTSRDFDLASVNDNPKYVWADNTHIWIADTSDNDFYVYNLDGTRDTTKDIDFSKR